MINQKDEITKRKCEICKYKIDFEPIDETHCQTCKAWIQVAEHTFAIKAALGTVG